MKKIKNAEIKTKNCEVAPSSTDDAKPKRPPSVEHGAESQLHNYNVMLTRLGDLFGSDDEPDAPKPKDTEPKK